MLYLWNVTYLHEITSLSDYAHFWAMIGFLNTPESTLPRWIAIKDSHVGREVAIRSSVCSDMLDMPEISMTFVAQAQMKGYTHI